MSAAEIRAAYAAGNSSWEVLHMVVAAGREFPDAEWAVKQALRLDDEATDEMVDGYDNNC